jgi:GPH family glycoside/pentoside/hexuronide:cation symporter
VRLIAHIEQGLQIAVGGFASLRLVVHHNAYSEREVMQVRAQRASGGTQFFYGFGSIAIGIKNNLLGTYLLIYYNQVLGLDAAVAALAMALALVVDAVSDPIVGIWSDRVSTRWGRRHPFMYAAIIPFALSYYFILKDPGPISDTDLFFRLLFLLIVLRMSMTFYEIPRGALAPELSKDYDQRNALSAWAMAFGWIGGAGIAFIANRYFLDSFVDLDGYQVLAYWGGLGIFVGASVSCLGTHRNIPDLHKPPARELNLAAIFKEGLETLSNRSWLVLFFSGCIYSLLVGTEQGVGTYYNEYFWQWKPEVIAPFALFSALSVVVLVSVAPLIARGRSKKKIAVGIFIVTIVAGPLPIILRLVNPLVDFQTFPANGSDLLWWILMFHGSLLAALGALGFVFIGSMAMEIVEQVEKKTGRREEGLLGTVNTFVHKLVGAGGVLVSGLIIWYAGFDNPGVTPEDLYGGAVITKFAYIHIVLGLSLPIISTLLVLLYDIDRNQHLDHIEELGYTEE